MVVIGAKLSKDVRSTKVAYAKGDKIFIRSGRDKFREGRIIQTTQAGLYGKWGFRKMESNFEVQDGEEMYNRAKEFELTSDGKVRAKYSN